MELRKARGALAAFLCICLFAAALPPAAAEDDWTSDVLDDPALLNEMVWAKCVKEGADSLSFTLTKQAAGRMSDEDIRACVRRVMYKWAMNGFSAGIRRMADGSATVEMRGITLRDGVRMYFAYDTGLTGRLTSREKSCLDRIVGVVEDMMRRHPGDELAVELEIYDYICDHVEYRSYEYGEADHVTCTSARNAFENGWGNCQAYADLFYLMSAVAGLFPGYVCGSAGGGEHLWNTVCVGGGLVMVDVTWGDTANEWYPRPSHYWFNFGLDRRGDREWDESEFMFGIAPDDVTNDACTYFNGRAGYGARARSVDEAARFLVREAEQGRACSEVLVRGEVSFAQLDAALKRALGKTSGEWTDTVGTHAGDSHICLRWTKYRGRSLK